MSKLKKNEDRERKIKLFIEAINNKKMSYSEAALSQVANNIGAMLFTILAQYCKLYRANIAMPTFCQYWPILAIQHCANIVNIGQYWQNVDIAILARYSLQYWHNIVNNIAPILGI